MPPQRFLRPGRTRKEATEPTSNQPSKQERLSLKVELEWRPGVRYTALGGIDGCSRFSGEAVVH